MKKCIKILLAFCLIALPVVASDLFFSTPIDRILQNPRDYTDKAVTISGTVVDIYSLVVVKYFILRDATGEITVATERPMPKKGSQIKVKGFVQEAFSIGDQQLIVLMEK